MILLLSKIRQVLLISVLSLSLLSCGVESIIAAGISGTGIVVGAITGFGSIIVNGVKYDIDEASFDVDGTVYNGVEGQGNLEIGMVVQLNATTYDDGTGVATSVVYDDAVEGPITDVPALLVDNNLKKFSVLGLSVTINELTTRFKSEDNDDFGFENISQGDVVEVSGYVDLVTNTIVATHVEKKGTLSDGTNEVELHGVIEGLEETFFIMNGFTIYITQIGPNDLEDIDVLIDGLFVEVEGEYQPDDGSIIATEIEGEDDERDEIENSDGHLSLEGVITSFDSKTLFSVNGIPVFLDSGVASSEVLEQLKVGVQVEVEGIMENGVLQVDEIELEGEEESDDD